MYQPTTTQSNGIFCSYNHHSRNLFESDWFKYDFRIDYSYLGTKSGILKLLQQICIVASFLFYSYYSTVNHNNIRYEYYQIYYHRSLNILNMNIEIGEFFYYIILGIIVLPVVHVLMWIYLMRRVEKHPKHPWFAIEYMICGGGAILCLTAVIFEIYRFYFEFTMTDIRSMISTLSAGFFFIFNFVWVRSKQKLKLPLQKAKPVLPQI